MDSGEVQYMGLALDLAGRGKGSVEPNPMVGAVIVGEGRVLGEGFHRRFGGPHAEIEAIAAARRVGRDLCGATMYVTLEPCRHHGKTPPCTDAIIAAGLARVVVAMPDPDEKVSGRGIEMLRRAKLDVAVGLCEGQARELLAGYIKLRTLRRPWVICKWAQTADGYLALPDGRDRWISCEQSRRRVHEIRSWCDGILVGCGTVLADDPLLTCRIPPRPADKPTRVVLDGRLMIPTDSRLVKTTGRPAVIVATTAGAVRANASKASVLRDASVELLELPTGAGGVDLGALLDDLGRREWTYLLVEGGGGVLEGFIRSGLADELRVFVSPLKLGRNQPLPRFDIAEAVAENPYTQVSREKIAPDTLLRFLRHPAAG